MVQDGYTNLYLGSFDTSEIYLMGGYVNIAVRLSDGRAVCQERWTNNMPAWFKRAEMFAGDPAHLKSYLDMVVNNDYLLNPGALGQPQPVENSEYGLIVWDFVSRTILDNNRYSNPTRLSVYDTDLEGFDDLADRGLLTLVRTSYSRRDPMSSSEPAPPTVLERTRLKSADEAHDRIEKYESKERANYLSSADVIRMDFEIDTSPMTYVRFGEFDDIERDPETGHRPLHPDFLAKLRDIGFPMSAAEGLNACVRPVPPHRKLSIKERLARELFADWRDQELRGQQTCLNYPELVKGMQIQEAPQCWQDYFAKMAAYRVRHKQVRVERRR